MRIHVGGDEILAWATDYQAVVVARVPVVDHLDDGADGFDLSIDEAKKMLAVFRPPSNPEARDRWWPEPMRVEVNERTITLTEAGGLLDGHALSVRRIEIDGEDRYPDVPRLLYTQLADTRVVPGLTALVDAAILARFTAASRAWGARLRILTPQDLPEVVIVQVGGHFTGMLARFHEPDGDRAARDQAAAWADRLVSLRRPERSGAPQAVT